MGCVIIRAASVQYRARKNALRVFVTLLLGDGAERERTFAGIGFGRTREQSARLGGETQLGTQHVKAIMLLAN